MFKVNANIFPFSNNTDNITRYNDRSGSYSGKGCIVCENEKLRDN
jgi:hypothetical protein